jgi:hypothetical protein
VQLCNEGAAAQAKVRWEGGSKQLPVLCSKLRVDPLGAERERTLTIPTQAGQHVVVRAGERAHQRGVVVKVTGAKVTVRLSDSHGGATVSLNTSNVHALTGSGAGGALLTSADCALTGACGSSDCAVPQGVALMEPFPLSELLDWRRKFEGKPPMFSPPSYCAWKRHHHGARMQSVRPHALHNTVPHCTRLMHI